MNWKLNELLERSIGSVPIYEGRVISLQVDDVELPNGQIAKREIVRHPGAVAILALHDDKLIVVAQYRIALGKVQIEIPAGKLETKEDPLTAAYRELEEETGYRAQSLTHLCSFYTSPGFADEYLHLYYTTDVVPGDAQPDDDEFLQATLLSFDEAQAYIQQGFISDAKTMLAVFAWQTMRLSGSFK